MSIVVLCYIIMAKMEYTPNDTTDDAVEKKSDKENTKTTKSSEAKAERLGLLARFSAESENHNRAKSDESSKKPLLDIIDGAKKPTKEGDELDRVLEKVAGSESSETEIEEPEVIDTNDTQIELQEYTTEHAKELRSEISEPGLGIEEAVELTTEADLSDAISEDLSAPVEDLKTVIESASKEILERLDSEPLLEQHIVSAPEVDLPEMTNDEYIEDESSVNSPPITVPTPAASGSGRGAPPPRPPQTPSSATPPPRPPVGPSSYQPFFAGPNLSAPNTGPSAPNMNLNVQPTANTAERTRRARAFLGGGILGYMIGRRGGRKRTEQKLQPKIEAQRQSIDELKQTITQKEAAISKAVHEKLLETPVQELTRTSPVETQTRTTIRSSEHQIKPTTEQSNTQTDYTSQKSILEFGQLKTGDEIQISSIGQTPELPDTAKRPEQFVTPILPKSEFTAKTAAETTEKTVAQPHVERLSTPDLLQIAGKINVEGTTIRRLYETNQLDRRGLEAVVKRHLASQDIAPALDQHLLGRETMQSRAREFRHDDPSFSAPTTPPTKRPVSPLLGTASMQDIRLVNSESLSPTPSKLPTSPTVQSVQPLRQIEAAPQSADTKNATKLPTFLAGGAIAAIAIALLMLYLLLR